jgi:hypothetical protein
MNANKQNITEQQINRKKFKNLILFDVCVNIKSDKPKCKYFMKLKPKKLSLCKVFQSALFKKG